MALAKQLMRVPMVGGLDQKTDPKLVQPGKLLKFQNGILDKTGRIKKRKGTTGYSQDTITPPDRTYSGNTLGAAEAMYTFGDQVLVANGKHLFSRSNTRDRWVDVGEFVSVGLSRVIETQQAAVSMPSDSAEVNGYRVTAWSYGGLFVKVAATDTDVELASVYSLGSISIGTRPRVVARDNLIGIFWQDGVNVKATRLDPAGTPIFVSTVTLWTDNDTTAAQLDVDTTGSNWVVAHGTTGSGGGIRVAQVNSTLTVVGSPAATVIAETPTQAIAVYRDSSTSNIYVAYGKSGNVAWFALNSSHSSVFSPTVLTAVGPSAGIAFSADPSQANRIRIWWTTLASGTSTTRTNSFNNATGAATGTERTLVDFRPASRAFVYNNVQYVVIRQHVTGSASYFLVSCEELSGVTFPNYRPACHGRFAIGSAVSEGGALPNFYSTSSGVFTGVLSVTVQDETDRTGIPTVAAARYSFDFASVDGRNGEVTLGQQLLLSGACPKLFDGTQIAEAGFNAIPEVISATSLAGPGLLTAGNTHRYIAVYEWTDWRGQRHRSAPSLPVDVTIGVGHNTVDVVVRCLHLTEKERFGRTVVIHLYRTLDGTVEPFYKITTDTSPTLNAAGSVSVTIQDTLRDIDIDAGPVLYTTGEAILANEPPPPSRAVTVFDGRPVVLDAESGQVWHGRAIFPFEGPAFSSFLRFEDPNPVETSTAVAVLDDKLVIFKSQRHIYVVFGQGPNDAGVGSTYSSPQEIVVDTGCNNSRSIVKTPKGLMFQTTKGIYLLDRALQLSFIGAPVADYTKWVPTGQQLTINSARVVEDSQQVRFTLYNADKTTLVYDYHFDQWGAFTLLHEPAAGAVWQGKWTWINAVGAGYFEDDAAQYQDAGTHYTMMLQTAWLKLGGIGGYQRIRRAAVCGTYRSSHTLNVDIFTDHNDNVSPVTQQSVTWTNPGSVSAGMPLIVDVHMQYQKCQALSFRVYDSTGNESFDLSELVLELGVKPRVAALSQDFKR